MRWQLYVVRAGRAAHLQRAEGGRLGGSAGAGRGEDDWQAVLR
jgi:hypothetical protein